MLVVDANVLVYAVDSTSAHHRASAAWLDGALAEGEGVGFAWTALLAFLRVTTNAAVFDNAMAVDDATAQLERWLDAPAAVIVEPTPRHAALLRGLLLESGTAGNLVNDAHLAALALEHGATIVSFDRDFARFEGVRWRLPQQS
ncbi:MAG: type II toxin-antitoxin system VapC family toxin [Gaiellaceae bacterium]